MAPDTSSQRKVLQTIFLPQDSPDVAIPLRRNIGDPKICPHHKPFLLLDHIDQHSSTSTFGPHPHRGQETITYIATGFVHHKDSRGNEGVIGAGDLQFMCAGRGAVHDERGLPDPEAGGLRGVQLWVALPEKDMWAEPSYSDLRGEDIPVVYPAEGVEVRVISGEAFGAYEPVRTKCEMHYLDVRLRPRASIEVPIPVGFAALAHVMEGTPSIAAHQARAAETVLLEREGEVVLLANEGPESAVVLLMSGDPLDGQEVHRNGPFVSTTAEGARQARVDFEERKNGFEGVEHMFRQ